MSSSTPSTPQKRSVGEELFLVHLRRQNSPHHDHKDDEDDHDYPQPRKRSRSIGEELYMVHLKRSEGCEQDYDTDPTEAKQEEETSTQPPKKAGTKQKAPSPKGAQASDDGMHLRDGRVISHNAQ